MIIKSRLMRTKYLKHKLKENKLKMINNFGTIRSLTISNQNNLVKLSLDNKVKIEDEEYNLYIISCCNVEIFKTNTEFSCDDKMVNILASLTNKKLDFELDLVNYKILKVTYNDESNK